MEKIFIFKRMHLIWSLLFILFPLFVVSSCEKQPDQFRQTQVSIFLINAEGKKNTQFKQDEIPIVVFEVVNAGENQLKFYPALHTGEYILLYHDQKSSESIGNFYSNRQYTNIILPSTFKAKTVTRIQLPWIWTNAVMGEVIECNLDEEQISNRETFGPENYSTYGPADNSLLAIGNYSVKLFLPEEWDIKVAQKEITFQVN